MQTIQHPSAVFQTDLWQKEQKELVHPQVAMRQVAIRCKLLDHSTVESVCAGGHSNLWSHTVVLLPSTKKPRVNPGGTQN
jgi:ribosomal protein S12